MESSPARNLSWAIHFRNDLIVGRRGDFNLGQIKFLRQEPPFHEVEKSCWWGVIDVVVARGDRDRSEGAYNRLALFEGDSAKFQNLLLNSAAHRFQSVAPWIPAIDGAIETHVCSGTVDTVNKEVAGFAEFCIRGHGKMRDPRSDLRLRFRVDGNQVAEIPIMLLGNSLSIAVAVADISEELLRGRFRSKLKRSDYSRNCHGVRCGFFLSAN